MPYHKSPKKRMRSDRKRNLANRSARSAVRSLTRKVRAAEKPEEAEAALSQLIPRLDKAAKKGLLHRNVVARQKSKAMKRVNRMKAAPKEEPAG
ncbi:MAG: 30S ribosomal protein S20 [Candidatus Eisenbacteria bacterium]